MRDHQDFLQVIGDNALTKEEKAKILTRNFDSL